MALCRSLPAFSLAADTSDGRYALTPALPQYPTSDSRHEHFVRPPPSLHPSHPSSAPSIRSTYSSLDKYPIPDLREVCPGVTSTGELTDNHPLVNTYLDVLARIIPRAPSKASASSATTPVLNDSPLPATAAAAALHQPPAAAITFWQAAHAGIASWTTVSNVISQQFKLFPSPASRLYRAEVPKLTHAQQQYIFALAALKVLNHPKHPAHFAFWAKNTMMRTADTVDDILRMKPCPIDTRVGWIGKAENVWALQGLQSLHVPKEPKGMTLRKRRAPAVTATQVEDEPAEARTTRKRARTTRASQKAQDAEAALAAEAVSQATEEAEEDDQASSLLFVSSQEAPVPERYIPAAAPTLEFMSRAVTDDLINGSPALEAIEIMLGLNQPSDLSYEPVHPVEGSADSGSSSLASPSATRRSTRARRKPAPPGPCLLLSTPPSTMSSPATPAESPLPLVLDSPREWGRSGSRGSSTAVSDSGYPSEEGTVVDAEISEARGASASAKGKRKAVEMIEDADADADEHSVDGPRRAKSKAKRAKTVVDDELVRSVGGEGDGRAPEMASSPAPVPAHAHAHAPAPVAKKTGARRKTATSGGKRKAARARA